MTKEEIITTLRGMVKHNEDEDAAIFAAIQALSKPSLPSDLDEAAENYSKNENPTCPCGECLVNTFKAGAEWMAGQGYIQEGIARPDDDEIWVNMKNTDIKDGDKVVVQIRKK